MSKLFVCRYKIISYALFGLYIGLINSYINLRGTPSPINVLKKLSEIHSGKVSIGIVETMRVSSIVKTQGSEYNPSSFISWMR